MSGSRRDVRMDVRMDGQTPTAKRRAKAPSEPAPRYGVLSEVDAEGRVWHYPVALELAAITPSAAVGARCPSAVFFMRAATRPGAPQTPVRFRSRLRAVRFTLEDAMLARETIRELKRMLAARSMAAGPSGPEREGT